mmetsp:Transcript_14117/g.20528  ORF Transcript_14117/g.20528 Transcript_14117/m.20528 type:complete len:431 (+) Transcript_14117:168-1460(+)
MQHDILRHPTGFGSGHRGDIVELSGLRSTLASGGQCRGDAVQGHIDLADLHSLTNPHRGGAHPGACARSRDDSGLDLVNDTVMPTHAHAHADGMHQNALMSLARENVLLKNQLQFASHEVQRLMHVLEQHQISRQVVPSGVSASQSRYWTEEEHQRFLDAIDHYGHKDVKTIATAVGTRNATQVRTHAQKYFIKLARSRKQGKSMGSNSDMLSNPDREEDMADDAMMDDDVADLSSEVAAFVAAAHSKNGICISTNNSSRPDLVVESGKGLERKRHASNHSRTRKSHPHGALDLRVSSHLVNSNVELVGHAVSGGGKMERSKMGGSNSRHRKREMKSKDGQRGPGSPGSMGSSDATSNGNGSSGSNGVCSSNTTNGHGSSNGSNGPCNENSSCIDSGGCIDSHRGASSNEESNQGSDGFFGDSRNFSDDE